MKKNSIFILFICFSVTLFAQDIVSKEPSNRNVILEELTGKGCQYCPDGHKRAQQLMNNYPGRFFAINVHQGGYANGTPNYTTPYGNSLASQAGMGLNGTGYPAGTVSRQTFENVPIMGSSYFLYDRMRWAACTYRGTNEPSCLNVAAKGTIDSTARKLTLLVEVYYTGNAVESTNKLTVAMLQNEILGPQSGGQQYNPDMMLNGQYRHMHMLRDFITGQWGVNVSPTTEGSFWSEIFEYDIPENINNIPVVLEDLEFIVFVAENNKTIISGSQAVIEPGTSHTIIASTSENGTITRVGDQNYPDNVGTTYFFIPDENYEVDEIFVDGEPVEIGKSVTSYTFPIVDKDYTIHVTFKLMPGYFYITSSAGENGTITPEGEILYFETESVTYIFTPDENYEVEEVYIDDEPMGLEQATEYTFTQVDKDYTIHVTFRLLENIKDVNGDLISVNPNPVNDKLFISGVYEKLEIISISGQIVASANNQPIVDVNHLSKGIYFVKIQSNNQSITFKIIK
ncbi:MAG: Omp28-related outer membrane protein [Bacteroidales bacterium]|nr:Omp28-related outer membrane protein [Bacteroidales bacterium]